LYFHKKGQKYFYTLDDKNHLIRKTLQGNIPKLNPYEGFSVSSNSGDVHLTVKISLEKFFKDYSSYHFLGNTSYRFIYANGKLTDIGPDSFKESITIPSPAMEIINAEIEEGLRGNYGISILKETNNGLKEEEEALLVQYPFKLTPFPQNFAFIFVQEKNIIVSHIYSTYLYLFVVLFGLLIFMLFLMFKFFKSTYENKVLLEKKSQ